jgi:hypothetical protein
MLPGRYVPDAEFAPAWLGTRVRLATLLSVVTVAMVALVTPVLMLQERHRPPWPVFLAVGIAPAVVAAHWFLARIRRYRVVGGELLVERPWRIVRFPLAGLQSVTPDREALRRMFKVAGNGGLGSISGRFRSKHLGPFRAYATDSEHAIVLRWPDRCLVISPQQHSLFVETVRKRAGLSH